MEGATFPSGHEGAIPVLESLALEDISVTDKLVATTVLFLSM